MAQGKAHGHSRESAPAQHPHAVGLSTTAPGQGRGAAAGIASRQQPSGTARGAKQKTVFIAGTALAASPLQRRSACDQPSCTPLASDCAHMRPAGLTVWLLVKDG